MKKLRIAMLASNLIRIPPQPQDVPAGYSGAPEIIVSQLTEELVKRGHDVTLFCSGNSKTKAKKISVTSTATSANPNISKARQIEYEHILISQAYQMAQNKKFDIIHSHFDTRSAPYAALIKTPTVSTLHSPLESIKDLLLPYRKTQFWISISKAQQKPIPDLKYAANIYHGLQMSSIPFNKKPADYLVFVGRIHPQKGIMQAIQIAKKLKKKLIIIGSANKTDKIWKTVNSEIKNNPLVIYKGQLPHEKVLNIVSRASAFLFPIQWPEPFGLVVTEAMACGTPVIAYNKGSMSELIQHKKTGFLVNSIDQAVNAYKQIHTIDRSYSRQYIINNFSFENTVNQYEKTYNKIIKICQNKK